VLTEASISGKVDHLPGLKENVTRCGISSRVSPEDRALLDALARCMRLVVPSAPRSGHSAPVSENGSYVEATRAHQPTGHQSG
jgi:hypothetical protein